MHVSDAIDALWVALTSEEVLRDAGGLGPRQMSWLAHEIRRQDDEIFRVRALRTGSDKNINSVEELVELPLQ